MMLGVLMTVRDVMSATNSEPEELLDAGPVAPARNVAVLNRFVGARVSEVRRWPVEDIRLPDWFLGSKVVR